MTNLIISLVLLAIPDCNGGWRSYGETYPGLMYDLGAGSNACYQATVTFHTQTNFQYRVLYKAQDPTTGKWGIWNYFSKWIPGTGAITNVSFGCPEPRLALVSVEIR